MPEPSQPKENAANEVRPDTQGLEGDAPESEELSAEELDDVSGAGLIYLNTGTSTGTVSTTPPPPPPSPPPRPTSPGAY